MSLFTFFGKERKLDELREELWKENHIPSSPPHDGKLYVDTRNNDSYEENTVIQKAEEKGITWFEGLFSGKKNK